METTILTEEQLEAVRILEEMGFVFDN